MGALPPGVEELIERHIDSVVRLEVLLQFHASPSAPVTAESVAERMRIELAWAVAQLEELRARGFVAKREGTPATFEYAPATPAVAREVDALAQAFADRRVAVISAIYSRPPDPLRSFTEAFNLRREPEEPNG